MKTNKKSKSKKSFQIKSLLRPKPLLLVFAVIFAAIGIYTQLISKAATAYPMIYYTESKPNATNEYIQNVFSLNPVTGKTIQLTNNSSPRAVYYGLTPVEGNKKLVFTKGSPYNPVDDSTAEHSLWKISSDGSGLTKLLNNKAPTNAERYSLPGLHNDNENPRRILAASSDGKYIVVGNVHNNALLRYTTNGFEQNATVLVAGGQNSGYGIDALTISSDNKQVIYMRSGPEICTASLQNPGAASCKKLPLTGRVYTINAIPNSSRIVVTGLWPTTRAEEKKGVLIPVLSMNTDGTNIIQHRDSNNTQHGSPFNSRLTSNRFIKMNGSAFTYAALLKDDWQRDKLGGVGLYVAPLNKNEGRFPLGEQGDDVFRPIYLPDNKTVAVVIDRKIALVDTTTNKITKTFDNTAGALEIY